MNIIEYFNSHKIKEVEALLEKSSNAYYNSDSLILTDKEYDELYKLYTEKTGKTIYGAKPEGKGLVNVKHSYENLVGTLFKLFNLDELDEFIDDMTKLTPNESSKIALSLKFDGNSVTIEYNPDGTVNKALTRGRGGEGKDLTHVFKDRKINLPKWFKNSKELKEIPFAVKYEAIITYENYDKLCKETGEDYANPRSTISGILGRDNAKLFSKYITLVPLEFKLYGSDYSESPEIISDFFGNDNYFSKYLELYTAGKKALKTVIRDYYNKVIEKRKDLPFMIDGIVIEFMNDADILKGYTPLSDGSRPYFKKALKLPYLESTTKVTSIDFSYGDTGRITPVVHFEPVEFLGNIQTKQNLHNYKRFKELKLGKDSEILLTYRSDCLSYVNKIDSEENSKITPFKFIEKCPICNRKLKIITNPKGEETFVECEWKDCSGKIVGRLENYLTKMNIKGIKTSTIEKLKDYGVENIEDLYRLNYEEISKIQGLGKKSAELIKKSIESKEYYDYEILGSLSIRNTSLETTKIVCKAYTLPELINLYNNGSNNPNNNEFNLKGFDNLYDIIYNLEGFSSIQTKYFVYGFIDNLDTIKFLMSRGYKTLKEEIKNDGNSLNIVFTGFRDRELQDKLEKQGHSVKSSVSSKTNLVITKDKHSNSTKIKAAREKGIEIISYQEALERF